MRQQQKIMRKSAVLQPRKWNELAWLCSVLTDTKEQTEWCIDEYKKHQKMEHKGANLLGIHLEGPFL